MKDRSKKGKVSPKGVLTISSLKKSAAFIMMLALALLLVSCEFLRTDKENNESFVPKESYESFVPNVENSINHGTDEKESNTKADKKRGEIIGEYQYPDNPAEQLRSALERDANIHGLEIGAVEKIVFDKKECSQIKINFVDSNENIGIITFVNKYLEYGYEESLDGRDNPSLTIVFKDLDNSQDMITVLTSVLQYLSPGLRFEEAEQLAIKQDDTISTDGYSMPQDIGGYQVQAHYTNPHIFVRTPDFEAKLGVRVRALKQMWGTIDTQRCQELKTPEDYNLLTARLHWEEGKHPEVVYGDFIVKNMWQEQSYIHGETWVVVDVESMTGHPYSLSLDTWEFPNSYEFGVNQQYTLYIGLNFRGGILHAIQRSVSSQFNSRGEVWPIDYPVVDWRNPVRRIEPDGEGTIYNVCFVLESQSYGEQFAALEGYGIGEKQWPSDPVWEGYAFVGWYDNVECNGNPYTKETPIYRDTNLYAKWKYSGSGGIWPRAHRGDVQGLDEEIRLSVGQKQSITVSGYNMNLETPKDQRFRWYPVAWRLSDGTSGSFSSTAPFQTVLSVDNKGEQRLYITYLEETFDGMDWQETGQLREVEEVAFWTE